MADSLLRLSLHERTASQGQLVASLLMAPLQGLDFWDRLGEIEIPVLIVHGAQDPIPIEMARAMDDSLPDSRLIQVGGSGHFPFIEQPVLFWTGVHAFLRQRPPEGP